MILGTADLVNRGTNLVLDLTPIKFRFQTDMDIPAQSRSERYAQNAVNDVSLLYSGVGLARSVPAFIEAGDAAVADISQWGDPYFRGRAAALAPNTARVFSEQSILRNAAITGRETRIDAAIKQLGVDRTFAEKIADAHDQVPCPVWGCTRAQLLQKMRIMGNSPASGAAIRSGLAGDPPNNFALDVGNASAPYADTTGAFGGAHGAASPKIALAPARFFKNVEILNRGGGPIGEFDGVNLDEMKFVEDKSAVGLKRVNPRTGMPAQTASDWARRQIFDKTNARIANLQEAVRTRPSGGATAAPDMATMRSIHHLEFDITDDSPEVRTAVDAALKSLRETHPNWNFTAVFGH